MWCNSTTIQGQDKTVITPYWTDRKTDRHGHVLNSYHNTCTHWRKNTIIYKTTYIFKYTSFTQKLSINPRVNKQLRKFHNSILSVRDTLQFHQAISYVTLSPQNTSYSNLPAQLLYQWTRSTLLLAELKISCIVSCRTFIS